MRILITGNSGHIGTILAPHLAKAGHGVVGLDTDLDRRSTFEARTESIRPIDQLNHLMAENHLGADLRWKLKLAA